MKPFFLFLCRYFLIFFFLICIGCTTPPRIPETVQIETVTESVLNLTFSGDIMSHTANFEMKDYDRIYDDVREILLSDSLSFGNLEAPVLDIQPMSGYPNFNMHTPYLNSAINGGFDIFSLANNHSNDQGEPGISGTLSTFELIKPQVYRSGLRTNKGDQMIPEIIRKDGWTVLFLSITEILNLYDEAGKLVYYVQPNEKSRAAFLSEIETMRAQNPCDLFVLSLHSNEPEYIRTVSDAKRAWFMSLASAGVDIIWGHHPHVMQQWETIKIPASKNRTERSVLCMFSMGNFISGQRLVANLEHPGSYREYTGDSVLLQVHLTRTGTTGYEEMTITPIPITNYSDPDIGPVVRLFNNYFISTLDPVWKTYYEERYSLMSGYLPLLPLTSLESIIEK